jgi:hypothetical protein
MPELEEKAGLDTSTALRYETYRLRSEGTTWAQVKWTYGRAAFVRMDGGLAAVRRSGSTPLGFSN